MLTREVLKPKLWLTSILDWIIYHTATWMVDNAGTNEKSKPRTLQEIKLPPWAEKAMKTGLPRQFRPKPRS